MVKRINSILILTILITLSLISYTFAGVHEELVKKYIEHTKIDEMLSSFPDQIEAMSAQNILTSAQPELEKKIALIMKESFDFGHAEQDFYSYLLQNTNIELLQDLNQWLETPLAKRITEEEVASSGPESSAEILHYIAELQTTPPSQDRISVIQELEKTTKLSELTTEVAIEIMRGMFEALNFTLPKENRMAMSDIEDEIKKIKPMIQESLRQQMILSSFYTYRNISSEDLNKYIAFYKSNTGQKELEIVGNAIAYVLRQWFGGVTEEIINLAKDELGNNN